MHPGVREAAESDLDRIRQLIIELARYERAADEVKRQPNSSGSPSSGRSPRRTP